MSVTDKARQLAALGEPASQETSAPLIQAAEQMSGIAGMVASVPETSYRYVEQAMALLGDGHQGAEAIAGQAAAVVETVERLQGQIEQLRNDLTQAQEVCVTFGFVIRNVGEQIAQGG